MSRKDTRRSLWMPAAPTLIATLTHRRPAPSTGRRTLWLAIIVLAIAIASPANATQPLTLKQLEQKAQALHLARAPMWLRLIHYKKDLFGSGFRSESRDPRFFLSPHGKTSPERELDATLKAIWHAGGGNESARCRFPARDHWLRKVLALKQTPVDCPALDAWMKKMDIGSVTLVFAASDLNNPSSMFGHTFLRLDPPHQSAKANLLLASTISYAADANAGDSEIMFAYRGIFGGYPGATSVLPYYDKVKEYSDLENRDLWEYHLNLKPQEIRWLLWHSWELEHKHFDYYFFDQNCASRLLELLDVARPSLHLTRRIGTHAIPSDTVRWVVDAGLVDRVHFRPSAATQVAYELKQMTPAERHLAHQLATGRMTTHSPRLLQQPLASQARILIAAYDYIQYMAIDAHWPRKTVAPRSFALLSARSQLPASKKPEVPTPPVRPDQGHPTFMAGLSGGQQDHDNYLQLTLRPAYHGLLDPPEGYRPGAELQFLRLDARYYTQQHRLQLQRLVAIDIRSLAARNAFFKPISWEVGFGARRRWVASGDQALVPYLSGGAGLSWSPTSNLLTSVLGTAAVEAGPSLERGFHLAPGFNLVALYQSPAYSLEAGIKGQDWTTGEASHLEVSAYAGAHWHITRRLGLSAQWQRTHYLERYHSTWQIGIHRYF